MRKILLGLTTALAIGALAVPTLASAASKSGRNDGSSRGTSVNANTNARSTANVRGTQNLAVNNNTQSWNGQKWAWDGRHHRRHHRDVRFVPFAVYGDDYAAYDDCWQTVWTPVGFQRVYVCGSNDYTYY
jgi:hypothetical protein